jgi:hypothetical protein
MTEQEWKECADPTPMLAFLQSRVSDRKCRLFACACCRRLWPGLSCSTEQRRAVEIAEQHADGLARSEELSEAEETLDSSGDFRDSAAEIAVQGGWDGHVMATECAEAAAWSVFYCGTTGAKGRVGRDDPARKATEQHEKEAQAHLLREVLGNPFRSVTLNPAWRTSNVTALAQAIYDDRAFDRLPILADALEDAGCDNADILNHCRQPGEHVRGCWVVDLLLGKE